MSAVHGACVAHVTIFRARNGADENSTFEIRGTYIARNASQESYTRARRVLVHPPLPVPIFHPFYAAPAHLAEWNCQEFRGCVSQLRNENKKSVGKGKETREAKRDSKGTISRDIRKTVIRSAMRSLIERAARSSECGRRSST